MDKKGEIMSETKEMTKRILIIDDDPQVAEILNDGLNTIGCSLVSALETDDGLRKASELKPDLIILDVIFPETNGYTVLEKLKTNPMTKDIPVIMLTVNNLDEDIQKGIDMGADDYVIKPIHVVLLFKRIQNLLNRNLRSESPLSADLSKGQKSMGHNKIVVVDDEADMTWLLKIELESEGYEVLIASDGEAGLELIKKKNPDLILMDVMMPKMNGYEALRRLKQDESTKQIPVLMLTAKGWEGETQKGLDLGAEDYILKPFHSGLLIKRIGNLMKKR